MNCELHVVADYGSKFYAQFLSRFSWYVPSELASRLKVILLANRQGHLRFVDEPVIINRGNRASIQFKYCTVEHATPGYCPVGGYTTLKRDNTVASFDFDSNMHAQQLAYLICSLINKSCTICTVEIVGKPTTQETKMRKVKAQTREKLRFGGSRSAETSIVANHEFILNDKKANELQTLLTSIHNQSQVITMVSNEASKEDTAPDTDLNNGVAIIHITYLNVLDASTYNDPHMTEEKKLSIEIPLGPNARPTDARNNLDLLLLLTQLVAEKVVLTSINSTITK